MSRQTQNPRVLRLGGFAGPVSCSGHPEQVLDGSETWIRLRLSPRRHSVRARHRLAFPSAAGTTLRRSNPTEATPVASWPRNHKNTTAEAVVFLWFRDLDSNQD